jgi:hypothetical protein
MHGASALMRGATNANDGAADAMHGARGFKGDVDCD